MSKRLPCLFVLATLSVAVAAQSPAVSPSPTWAPLAGLPGLPGDDVVMFVSSELGGRGVVKGAPYTATTVSENRQTLADGNRISRSSTMKIARDGQGRTRQDQPGGIVFINDTVAGKRYALNTQKKTARELPVPRSFNAQVPASHAPPVPPVPPVGAAPQPPKPPAQMSEEEARSWAEEMRRWGREFAARMRGEAAIVERDVNLIVKRSGSASEPVEIESERIKVIRGGDQAAMHLPLLPSMLPPESGVTTSLGSRDFDGVRADGTKTTWTIPAGRIGNEKPIEIVSERWYSPELMLVVESRHSDPRSGERIYRLEGLKRGEPPSELFRLPPDFELRPAAAPRAEKREERREVR